MELSGLLIPVLGGYWLLTRIKSKKYWTYRQSGYHLFFHAALWGILLLIASWPISRVLTSIFSDLPWENNEHIPFDYPTLFLVTLGLAWLVPLAANKLIYRTKSDDYFARKAAKDHGNLVDWIIQEALDASVLVEVSTKNGKCYAGLPQSISPTAHQENDVVLLPLLSGYRDAGTRELIMTMDYRPILKQWSLEKKGLSKEEKQLGHLSSEDFLVALPHWEIASARRFDLKLYESHFSKKPGSRAAT